MPNPNLSLAALLVVLSLTLLANGGGDKHNGSDRFETSKLFRPLFPRAGEPFRLFQSSDPSFPLPFHSGFVLSHIGGNNVEECLVPDDLCCAQTRDQICSDDLGVVGDEDAGDVASALARKGSRTQSHLGERYCLVTHLGLGLDIDPKIGDLKWWRVSPPWLVPLQQCEVWVIEILMALVLQSEEWILGLVWPEGRHHGFDNGRTDMKQSALEQLWRSMLVGLTKWAWVSRSKVINVEGLLGAQIRWLGWFSPWGWIAWKWAQLGLMRSMEKYEPQKQQEQHRTLEMGSKNRSQRTKITDDNVFIPPSPSLKGI